MDGTDTSNPTSFFLEETQGNIDGVCMGSVTFDVPGVYTFTSSVGVQSELGMTGTIIVDAPTPTTVVDIIVNSPDLHTLEIAVLAAGLEEYLSTDGPFTVFAPTDVAFAAIESATLASVFADIETLTSILTLHVHGGNVLAADLVDQMMVPTLNGEEVTISLTDSGAYVNNALITFTDLVVDNGVVHVIDKVLLSLSQPGCVDAEACNFDPLATIEDGSCVYAIDECGVCGGSGIPSGFAIV